MINNKTSVMSTAELQQHIQLINNKIRILCSDIQHINHEGRGQQECNREKIEKVNLNKQLPYLLGNVAEVLEPKAEDGLDSKDNKEGGATDVDAQRKTRSAVICTLTRQTIYLPVPGLVDAKELKPSNLVGTNKALHLILKKLPAKFDLRVKAMEVNKCLTEEYFDIGGANKQIHELIKEIVLPMTHKSMFDTIGIKPPKGVLLHGPPCTGKNLLVRACVNQTNIVFFKLTGPQLVQMFIVDKQSTKSDDGKRWC
jgi:26S proteasome regulatory subunit T5